ncbi:hypothetical protein BDM02DRAFT_3192661 [Thelephora ganbajun]|uniref:Uncharacterized protein n=1 Tax=Thelephora ganbajun TaxID=370292 RepID=A0ACB6YZD8_THEGA|nr:hypothetical protein BDM02DRAFT_3192661 [Thelephora ganbajun]
MHYSRSTGQVALTVRLYLQELDPIIWLPTDLWFTFALRRVNEFSRFQERLSLFGNWPENYGGLTCILTHVIQQVGVTPIPKDHDLRNDLKELRFDMVCNWFGCFFLHNLDLTNGQLSDVQQQDPPEQLKRIGVTTTCWRENIPQPELLPSPDALTWEELKRLVNKKSHRVKIQPWKWDPLWTTYSAGRALFCEFTHTYWLANAPENIKMLDGVPATLEQAVRATCQWTHYNAQWHAGA